ncbi:MAG: hypothetical protein ABIC04_04465 [Nanoarchaeota archaeon]
MYEKLLEKEAIKKVNILVATPSFNEEENISFITKKVDMGLRKHYPAEKALILNCDSGSLDCTKERFNETKTKTKKLHIGTPHNEIGKGNALKVMLEIGSILKPEVIVINDSDLKSLSVDWIKFQAQPIFDGYDFVAPYYKRFKYDGTITNNICYPLVASIFGEKIRQPIGGEFSFAGKLAPFFLNKCKWTNNTRYFGIDIFMTANAILGNFKICQANLGVKVHSPKDPGTCLSPMFRQVISTMFKIICDNKSNLKERKIMKQIPILGKIKGARNQIIKIDKEGLKHRFITGFGEQMEIIKKCLPKESYNKIKGCAHYGKVKINSELWSRIVYDYIIAFKKYEHISSTILRSFEPLWLGRTYSFVEETRKMTTDQAERLIKEQVDVFFKNRDYLFKRL